MYIHINSSWSRDFKTAENKAQTAEERKKNISPGKKTESQKSKKGIFFLF